jgi:hypothetical protein
MLCPTWLLAWPAKPRVGVLQYAYPCLLIFQLPERTCYRADGFQFKVFGHVIPHAGLKSADQHMPVVGACQTDAGASTTRRRCKHDMLSHDAGFCPDMA